MTGFENVLTFFYILIENFDLDTKPTANLLKISIINDWGEAEV